METSPHEPQLGRSLTLRYSVNMAQNYYGAPQYSYGYSGQQPVNPYAYGGYSGYGGGGYGSMGYNPFGGYQMNPYTYNQPGNYDVGGMYQGGQQGWGGQQAGGFNMQDYIKQYLTNLGYTQQQQQATTTPTTTSQQPAAVDVPAPIAPAADVPAVPQYGGTPTQVGTNKGDTFKYNAADGMQNFGAGFINTGTFGAKGIAGIQQMGYANPEEYLAANTGMQGLRDNYVTNQAAKQAARRAANTNVIKSNSKEMV